MVKTCLIESVIVILLVTTRATGHPTTCSGRNPHAIECAGGG
jgi:hypothetical protein